MSLDSLNNNLPLVTSKVKEITSVDDFNLSANVIIVLLAFAGIIFGFFYLLKKYIIPLFETAKERKKTKLLVFRVEVIVWTVYSAIGLTQLFSENLFITGSLLAVAGLVGVNFWRDFFPGLLLRVSNKFKTNDAVRFKENIGKIKRLGIMALELKTNEEELLYIPYRKVTNEIFVKRQAKGRLMSSKIILQIGEKNANDVIELVNIWLFECPWAVPQSKNTASIQAGGLLHVTVYAVDSSSLGKVERFIKDRLESV